MNDRLKRRKKGGEGVATGTGKEKDKTDGPEPLQPKYFESDLGDKSQPSVTESAPAPQAEPVKRSRPETQADFRLTTRPISPPPSRIASVAPPSDAQPDSVSSPTSDGRPRPARRRRKRGGRGGAAGGSGRGQSSASAVARRSPQTHVTPGEGAAADLAEAAPLVPLTPETSAELPPVSTPHVPPAASTAARPSKGTVVLAIGLPGSGKSSWFKRHNIHPLSSDLLRELLFDDPQEQRFQDLVFSNLRSMLKARLIARRPLNYVDATNLTPHDRNSWIKLAKDYGYDVQGLYFDVPLEVCMERHQRRGRAIPEDIMRKMAGKLKPPTFEEGFSKITVVRVKQKENVESEAAPI